MEQKITVEEQHNKVEATEEDAAVDDWFEAEGELAVDVYETDEDIVVQSALAGVRPEELDISVEEDVVTIRGVRKNPNSKEKKAYLHEECFWGPFSRQIFLPGEIDVKQVEAAMADGVLTLRLPKVKAEKAKQVKIEEE